MPTRQKPYFKGPAKSRTGASNDRNRGRPSNTKKPSKRPSGPRSTPVAEPVKGMPGQPAATGNKPQRARKG